MLANTLHELANESDDLIFLTGDLGFGVFDDLQRVFPSRYINVGIAEAAMVTAAAGLSATGFMPVVYSIASFMSARPYEQIKLLAGYNEFPMIIIGAGGGVTYGMSGASHHATDDLGLMSLIPGMEVAAPAGPLEMREVIRDTFYKRKSAYVQIGKFGETDLAGRQLICDGKILAISTGTVSHELYKAVLSPGIKDSVDFMHISKISELSHLFSEPINKNYASILVVEEHILNGGLYSQVLHAMNSNLQYTKVLRLGLQNVFIKEFNSQEEIRKQNSFDAEGIARKLSEILRNL
jgi:transketolase